VSSPSGAAAGLPPLLQAWWAVGMKVCGAAVLVDPSRAMPLARAHRTKLGLVEVLL
jgi:hypothetical protein